MTARARGYISKEKEGENHVGEKNSKPKKFYECVIMNRVLRNILVNVDRYMNQELAIDIASTMKEEAKGKKGEGKRKVCWGFGFILANIWCVEMRDWSGEGGVVSGFYLVCGKGGIGW